MSGSALRMMMLALSALVTPEVTGPDKDKWRLYLAGTAPVQGLHWLREVLAGFAEDLAAGIRPSELQQAGSQARDRRQTGGLVRRTEDGIEPLNPDTAEISAPSAPVRDRRVVVVLTALELEYAAMRAHLQQVEPIKHPAGTIFEVGRLPGLDRPVALAVIGEGNSTAAVVTERAAAMFAPDAVFFVGIAGALHSDIALGDVIVATRVYLYHSGCQNPDGFSGRPRAWDAPHTLEQLARHVARSGRWRHTLDRDPAVVFRPIAAGEVVINAVRGGLADQILRHANDTAAVEMEAAGVARAAHLNQSLPALIIRGISDRADGKKHTADRKGGQLVAAAHAAAFAVALIRSMR